ncbi:MAG: M48 family metallopeptidase [Oscillatoria sp. SIO1A7]|nr:M48 family metallopeptidase [Oscillatoria sp. SIO1A7]
MIRIAGIVKAAQVARNRLQAGIPASEVTSFQEFVTGTLAQVEQICTQAEVTPEKLPTPSRKAYYFLKKLDLNNLPVADEGSNTAPATAPAQAIRIDNIRRQQQAILERIADLAKTPSSDISRQELIAQKLAQNVREIERICGARQATPGALTDAARNTYAWMKFLTEDPYLDLHIEATRRIRQILETMPELPETLELAVEFSNIASLYKWKKTDKALELQINEGFIAAEDDILEAIAATAVSGKTKAANQKIKQFSVSEPCREILFRLDAIANIETETSQGRCYDLELLFAKVNREYFQGEMAKPRLTWNRAFTKRCFGYYERSRDRVVISQTLDDSRVPEFVVEYVLYHELLHKKHGEQWQGGRRAVHTKSFRRDELKFAQYNEAEAWLSSLSNL